ncbi:hypothetical protein C3K47_15675 [Solitalea longa]|uniref:PDZ domain-containing protein n=1 Tax=Solitalea longa TaxID=2079460 RepID=A0A2S4ZZQ0_9SPHI|nr:hypothetical protein [Solitalea longa]POY35497.1 hypothetical protein C3K47_15675 [Solitalea longa]
MKKNYFIFLAIIFFPSIYSAYSQVTPNSNRFDVENYIAIDNNGKYYPYTAHGFYENAVNGATARIYLLPILKLDLTKIKFIDQQGRETYQSDENIRAMIIPVTQDLALPNESQKAAIDAAINGHSTIKSFYSPIVKNSAGIPLVNPFVNSDPILYNQIMTMANNYEVNAITPQQQLINDYNTRYKAQIISLTELEIIVEAGSEVVYTKRIPATWITTGKSLSKITIDNPSDYVKNLIAGGNGQILFSYKFKDSKSSTISAHIDATAIVNQFLSEAYQSSVSQTSSGWSFLGLGSSQKSIRSSFDQQINQQYNSSSISNTTIEMYDADDQMVKEFENKFFPTLSQQEAIQNHINAAEKAITEGNTALQNLHLKYVESLQNNNPNLTPNFEAAVAALGKNDYIGFIANGVRWGSNSAISNNSFRRVLNSSEMQSMAANWNQFKVISIQHIVTQPVTVSEEVKFKASLGTIDAISFQNNLYISNGFSLSMQNINGVFIGPITVGGALHQSNITPGTLMTRIGSYSVYSGQTLIDALNHFKAGDKIYLTLITPTINPNVFQEQRVQVTLGAYPSIN